MVVRPIWPMGPGCDGLPGPGLWVEGHGRKFPTRTQSDSDGGDLPRVRATWARKPGFSTAPEAPTRVSQGQLGLTVLGTT
jgi:hypothetical protein